MRTQAGVWIDRRKAVIVTVTEDGEDIGLIISKVEEQLRRAGDSPLKGSYEAHRVPADDSRQRALTKHLIFSMMRSSPPLPICRRSSLN